MQFHFSKKSGVCAGVYVCLNNSNLRLRSYGASVIPTSLHLAYKKKSIGVCCTGVPSFKLDLHKGDPGCCIQDTIWTQVLGESGDCFDPCLTGAVMKGMKMRGKLLWVGHVGSCTARVVLVRWYLGFSERLEICKQTSLVLLYLL